MAIFKLWFVVRGSRYVSVHLHFGQLHRTRGQDTENTCQPQSYGLSSHHRVKQTPLFNTSFEDDRTFIRRLDFLSVVSVTVGRTGSSRPVSLLPQITTTLSHFIKR